MFATEPPPPADPVLDAEQVRVFWENQGRKLGVVPLAGIANLEERPELLELKLRLEQECVDRVLPLTSDLSLLDLGAGVGQWTGRLAPRLRRVVAVEYAEAMAAIGRAEMARLGLANVEFITASAQDFDPAETFDVIFISGLLLYLDDRDARALVARLSRWLRPGGRVLVRDAVSILASRHLIANRYSAQLRCAYSALYRTAAEIRTLFAAAGLDCVEEGSFFPEGNPLNKFPETRLKYFLFQPGQPRVIP